jgi:integrase
VLSHAFTKAIEWGAADRNPCREVRKFSERKRDRYVEDWEYDAVYALAGPMMRITMDLAVLTGLRRGDLLKLTRDNLVDDGILVQTSKTGKPLLIEWSDELRDVIARAKKIKPQVRPTLICNRQGKQYTGQGFAANWQRLIKHALEKEAIKQSFRFHDLRAKSASDDTLEAATLRLGHVNASLTERVYRRKPRRVKPLR